MQPQFADGMHALEQRPDLMKGSTSALPYPHEDKLQGVVSVGSMYMSDGPTVRNGDICFR